VKAILQVTKGPLSGEEFVLDAGQSALVGGDKPARFVLSDDPSIERIHFALEWVSGVLRIKDMNTPGGTHLNGERITAANLKDKDRIVVGGTSLIISMGLESFKPAAQEQQALPRPGGWSMRTADTPKARTSTEAVGLKDTETKRPQSAMRMPSDVAASAAPSPTPPQRAAQTAELPVREARPVTQLKRHPIYNETRCESGLFLCTPETATPTPADLCAMLAASESARVYLLADLAKADAAMPWDIETPDYLFDWLPPAVAAESSPVLIAQDQTKEFYTTMDACWGCDAALCLITSTPRDALLVRLRSMTRATATPPPECATEEDSPTLRDSLLGINAPPTSPSPGASEAVVAFYIPSVLASRLAEEPDDATDQLVDGVDAILVEADAQAGWQLFTKRSFGASLETLGFVPGEAMAHSTTSPSQ
jgi:hypothetical protein